MTEHERGTLMQSSEFFFLNNWIYIYIKGSVLEIIYKKWI